MSNNKQRGFTLIELMVVLAVAGILAGVVAPGFQEMIRNNRITADVNHFVAASHAARSEALKTGAPILLQRVAGDWNNGWTVDETVSGGTNITTFNKSSDIAISSTFTNISYNSRGLATIAGIAPFTLQFCDSRTGETGRQITISLTGRVSTDEFACP